jgi:hypothetical protein
LVHFEASFSDSKIRCCSGIDGYPHPATTFSP